MNDSLKADARRFRFSLAASVFLNIGLLGLVAWLGRPTDLGRPQGRPHLRMVTLSRLPAPASSARQGSRAGTRRANTTSLTSAAPSLPPQHPFPRPMAPPRPFVQEVAAPRPALHIVTTIQASVRVLSRPTPSSQPLPAPPLPSPPSPYIPAPARLPLPERRTLPTHYTLPPISVPAVPTVPAPTVSVVVPPPDPPVAAPAAHITARRETSRGATGGGAGLEAGTREDTNRKAGGPFGIGDGLAAEGVTRHIVYVLDTSGSMKSRLGRAEDELMESLRGLHPGETFNIIAFSGRSELFDADMAEAAPGNIQRASAFLSDLAASGDTDLEDAVVRALMLRDVNEVVVLTDGIPTVGETDPEKLAGALRRFNLRHARISTIGLVGRNPDGTGGEFAAGRLLQRIARDSGGASKLVNLGSEAP